MNIDKAKGIIFGLAIGDALGYPTEFLSLRQIKAEFGSNGISDLPKAPALYTDDTQMTHSLTTLIEKTVEDIRSHMH